MQSQTQPTMSPMSHERTPKVGVLCIWSVVILTVVAVLTIGVVPTVLGQPPAEKPRNAALADTKTQARVLDSYGKLPLSFEGNHGQADGRVMFLSRTGRYTLFLTQDEAALALRGRKANTERTKFAGSDPTPQDGTGAPTTDAVLRMKFRNANPAARVTGLEELAGTSNYFIGNDPAKWRTSVPTYAKVKYEGIYAGIDLVFYGNQRQLEYDFIVKPGADPRRIGFDVRGAKRIRRDEHGDLVLKVGHDEIRWRKPVVYQEKDGTQQEIAARYSITDTNRVGFEVAKYDVSRPLYIDPLIYSTYLGGSGEDYGQSIAVDSAGNAYVTGFTGSTNFPTTPGAFETTGPGGFVSKLNPMGSALLYSTYLDGGGPSGIAVDSAGNAYVTGGAGPSFPTTEDALQPVYSGNGDAFVAKLNPSGSALVYSTYLGGSGYDQGNAIAVDSAGNAYVTGGTRSTNFPTMNPLQPANAGGLFGDAFVAKINAAGSALAYSTYLGGSDSDQGNGIAVDSAGNAYVTGFTGSTNFPTTPGAFETTGPGGFVSKLNPIGSALLYSTYLDGGGPSGIALDSAGNAYVAGSAGPNFPTTKDAVQPTFGGGNSDAFVAKLNPLGSGLMYSTYLGGSGDEDQDQYNFVLIPGGIAVDSKGSVYVTGNTFSSDFPTTPGAFQTLCNHGNVSGCTRFGDAFVTRLTPSGSALVYSTYLGGRYTDEGVGIAVDRAGNAYVTGFTVSTDFPTKNPLTGTGPDFGNGDAFVTKIDMRAVTTTTLSSSQNPSIYGQAVIFTGVVSSGLGAPPNGEPVTFMKGAAVLGTAMLSGGTASFTTSALPAGTDYIKAVYGGDANFAPSTAKAVSQVVNGYATSTVLVSSLNPSSYGQKVTWTATVTSSGSIAPAGTVKFVASGHMIGSATLNSRGVATLTKSNLNADSYSLTAVYLGGAPNLGSTSAVLNQVVVQTTSSATLTSSPNPSIQGQSVTFTAKVSSPTVIPTGPVTFTVGKTVLGTAQLSGGKATLTISSLGVGSTKVTATYYGDSNIAKSSASVIQTVQ
jgi:hypothetical protein